MNRLFTYSVLSASIAALLGCKDASQSPEATRLEDTPDTRSAEVRRYLTAIPARELRDMAKKLISGKSASDTERLRELFEAHVECAAITEIFVDVFTSNYDTRPDEIDAREMSSRTRLLAGGECSGPH